MVIAMRVLIILGGRPPSPELLASQLDWADEVVAADSGIDPLLELGVEPDLLTGDFDSVRSDLSKLSCRVEHDPSQYATDFEKALSRSSQAGDLHILGACGGRTDHLLSNLLIAAGIDPRRRVVIFSDREIIHRITPECPLDASPPTDTLLSLIPFCSCHGVSTAGLKWDLDSAEMGVGAQLGQSNIVYADRIEVEIGSGCMYCILQSENSRCNKHYSLHCQDR